MHPVDKFDEWVTWSQANLKIGEELRAINDLDNCPWYQAEISAEPVTQDSLEVFVKDPEDLPARFTVLSYLLHCSLLGYEHEDVDEGNRDAGERWRSYYRKLLKYFVRLLPLESCGNWTRTKWEIINAYAAGDYEFADEMYAHAERQKQLEIAESNLLRGQFEFVRSCGPEIEQECNKGDLGRLLVSASGLQRVPLTLQSLAWLPVVHGEWTVPIAFLWRWCLALREQPPVSNSLETSLSYLRKAFSHKPSLKRFYLPLLARAHVSTGEYSIAAAYYLEMEKYSGGEFSEAITFAAARCFRWAGDYPRAIELLTKGAAKSLKAKGMFLEIAEIESNRGNSLAAGEALAREKERNTDFGEDWRTSTILALYEISKPEEGLKNYLALLDPTLADAVTSFLSNYWQNLGNLSAEAQSSWVGGVSARYFAPQLGSHKHLFSAIAFAKALELEIKERIFAEFRKSNSCAPEEASDDKHLLKFLGGDDKELTLGRIAFIVESCKNPKSRTHKSLKEWLRRNHPQFFDDPMTTLKLKFVSEKTGAAKHKTFDEQDSGRIELYCRALLDLLVSSKERLNEKQR